MGAGLTGLLTAIFLKQQKASLSISVLERGVFSAGASVKNAGFGCFGSPSELLDDIRSEGEATAIERVAQRYEGLQRLLQLVELSPQHIQYHHGYEVFDLRDESLFQECHQTLGHLNSLLEPVLGFQAFSELSNSWGFKALDKAFLMQGEVSLHSGILVKKLWQIAAGMGIKLLAGVDVQVLDRKSELWKLSTSQGDFHAPKVVLATNAYVRQLFPHLAVEPARGQILLTTPVPGVNLEGNFHLFRGYYYFRMLEGRLLLGGGRHLFREEENTTSTEVSKEVQQELERVLQEIILPGHQFSIEKRWAGTMAFGPDNEKEAIVRELEPGLYAGVRLGGMGVALASAVAEKLGKLTLG